MDLDQIDLNQEENSQNTCSICLDDIDNESNYALIENDKNIYHVDCLDNWVRKSGRALIGDDYVTYYSIYNGDTLVETINIFQDTIIDFNDIPLNQIPNISPNITNITNITNSFECNMQYICECIQNLLRVLIILCGVVVMVYLSVYIATLLLK
jgi:hypothetical protein